MSLLEQAAADVAGILQNVGAGSVPITVTTPDGEVVEVQGFAADIGQSIDPDTGQVVTSRRAHVTLPFPPLAAVGLPNGKADERQGPWTVEFSLPGYTAPLRFRIAETMPDRTVGCVVCFLTALQG